MKLKKIKFGILITVGIITFGCIQNLKKHPGEPYGIDWQKPEETFVCHKLDSTSLPPFSKEAEAHYREGLRLWKTRKNAEDVIAARTAFEKGAKLGHWKAMNNLAIWAGWGRGGPQDYELSFSLFSDLARQGVAIGYHSIGVAQQNGYPPFRKANLAKAMRWYEQAALRGYTHSQVLIGKYLLHDLQRKVEGLQWLHCADSQDYGPAATAIGEYFEIVKDEYKTALIWYLRGGSLGDKGGGANVQLLIRNGYPGVPKDLERSKCISKYIKKMREHPNKPIGDLAKLCPPTPGLETETSND